MDRLPIRVVAGLLTKPDSLEHLIAKRAPHLTSPHCWEYPGGKVKPGESDNAALEREWWEELQVEVQAGRMIGSYRGGDLQVMLYEVRILRWYGEGHLLGRWNGSLPHPKQCHSETRWMDPLGVLGLLKTAVGAPSMRGLAELLAKQYGQLAVDEEPELTETRKWLISQS